MLNKEAIDAINEGTGITQSSEAVAKAFKDKAVVMLPEHFTERDLEEYLPARRRARGVMRTNTLKDFAEYTTAHKEEGATVFIDASEMSASAVLDLGTPAMPGHADNRAVLQLKKTAAYAAVLAVAQGRALSQTIVAEFLEDWTEFTKCYNDDGEVTRNKAIAAVRKLSIESSRKIEASEQSLSASKSAFESVQATSQDPIPTVIYFTCEPYKELAVRTFVLRLGVLTSGDKPSITLRIVKQEVHDEEMANELADLTRAELKDSLPVLLGEYKKGN